MESLWAAICEFVIVEYDSFESPGFGAYSLVSATVKCFQI
jgi:hypothetical protein